MRDRSRRWRVPHAAMALLFMAGCANTTFVYKPNAPSVGGPKLLAKVAVLPFKDGTEDFTKPEGFFSTHHTRNMAKTGISILLPPLPPDLWAKSFADDMTASGGFQAVRFIYSPSELEGEEFYIEGTLVKAYLQSSGPNEFALRLRAVRRVGNEGIWEKEVAREWEVNWLSFDEGCGLSRQCQVDKVHAVINRAMQGMFAEARADLVETLASLSPGGIEGKGPRSVPSAAWEATGSGTSKPESVEQTIDKILKGK